MKHKFAAFLSIISILSLLFCSCDGKNTESNSSPLPVSEVSSEQPADYGTEVSPGMKKVDKPAFLSSDEWIASVVQVDNHRGVMLIESDRDLLKKAKRRIVLYDFAADRASAEQEVECYTLDLHEYENGVYVTGYTDSPYSTEQIPLKLPVLITYDRELNVQREYDFTVLGDNISAEQARMSYDGSKIAYFRNKSMYICDSDKAISEGSCLFTLGSGKGMTAVSDFGFTQNGETIACTGKCNNGGKTTNGYGKWSVEGEGKGFGCGDYSEQLILGGNKMLLIDPAAPYGSTSSGMANLRNFENGDSTYITFEKKNESSAAILSNGGKYIISYLDGKSNDGKGMIRFSVYSADSLQKLCSYDYTGQSDTVNCMMIYANDESNKAFTYLTDGTEQFFLEMAVNEDTTK